MFDTQRRQSDDDKVPVAIDLGKNNDAVLLALAVVAAYSTSTYGDAIIGAVLFQCVFTAAMISENSRDSCAHRN